MYVKCFPGANVNDMKSYVIPSKTYNNDLIILHCGTNSLRENKKANEIANEIVEIAMDLKNEDNDIMISGIVPRNDRLDAKGVEVNSILKMLCDDYNFNFVDNSNIYKFKHFNSGGYI